MKINCLHCNIEFEQKRNSIKFCSIHCSRKHNIKPKHICENENCQNLVTNNINRFCSAKCSANSKLTQSRRADKCIKKYGVDNVFKRKDIIDNITNNRNERVYSTFDRFKHIALPMFSEIEFTGGGSRKVYKWKCVKCNSEYYDVYDNGIIPRCSICYPCDKSVLEYTIKNFLTDCGVIFRTSRLVLSDNRELDIHIIDKKLAIEVNGLYYHSELTGKKSRNYHLNKTKECEEKSIRLIHIFEDEINSKLQIVKNRLKNALGLNVRSIGARECDIRLVDSELSNKFLNKYHIQGKDLSKVKLGLFYKNRLVALMTFCKRRAALGGKNVIGSWELSRFVTLGNFRINGGANKLLSYFEKEYKPIELISYSDRRWNTGNLYINLGFKLDHISEPNYWYFKRGNVKKRFHRYGFRKSELKRKLENFDPLMTEWQNMQNNGWDRVWDCGNLVFVKKYM